MRVRSSSVHRCTCAVCRTRKRDPVRALHAEQQRRWFVALEAGRVAHGGAQRLAPITGLSPHTIRRGRRELDAGRADRPTDRVRTLGGGRPAREAQDPALIPALEAVLVEETAGDPMGRRAKATRRALAPLSATLTTRGHAASRPTVSRLLRQLGYSPKRRRRATRSSRTSRRSASSSPPPASRSSALTAKKKELVGDFHTRGRRWCQAAAAVLVHDWPQDAVGQAIPYGI